MSNELKIDQKLNGSENIRWDLADLFNGINDPRINESLALSGDRAVAFKHKYKKLFPRRRNLFCFTSANNIYFSN